MPPSALLLWLFPVVRLEYLQDLMPKIVRFPGFGHSGAEGIRKTLEIRTSPHLVGPASVAVTRAKRCTSPPVEIFIGSK